jgi:hypothetical protein
MLRYAPNAAHACSVDTSESRNPLSSGPYSEQQQRIVSQLSRVCDKSDTYLIILPYLPVAHAGCGFSRAQEKPGRLLAVPAYPVILHSSWDSQHRIILSGIP